MLTSDDLRNHFEVTIGKIILQLINSLLELQEDSPIPRECVRNLILRVHTTAIAAAAAGVRA